MEYIIKEIGKISEISEHAFLGSISGDDERKFKSYIRQVKSNKALLDNRLNDNNDTALVLTARYKRLEMTRQLVDVRVNLDLANKDGCTALMQAADHGYAEMVELLMTAGASLNLVDHAGRTALLLAVIKGEAEVVRLLVDYGALIIVPHNGHIINASIIAERRGYTAIAAWLRSKQVAAIVAENNTHIGVQFSDLSRKIDDLSELVQTQRQEIATLNARIVVLESLKDKNTEMEEKRESSLRRFSLIQSSESSPQGASPEANGTNLRKI